MRLELEVRCLHILSTTPENLCRKVIRLSVYDEFMHVHLKEIDRRCMNSMRWCHSHIHGQCWISDDLGGAPLNLAALVKKV